MNVGELIENLMDYPSDAEVYVYTDVPEVQILARNGYVNKTLKSVTTDFVDGTVVLKG